MESLHLPLSCKTADSKRVSASFSGLLVGIPHRVYGKNIPLIILIVQYDADSEQLTISEPDDQYDTGSSRLLSRFDSIAQIMRMYNQRGENDRIAVAAKSEF